MSRVCEICGKGRATGNNVSHSMRHTKRTFDANIQKVDVEIDGKKGKAEKILYGAFDMVKEKTGKEPMDVFNEALEKVVAAHPDWELEGYKLQETSK